MDSAPISTQRWEGSCAHNAFLGILLMVTLALRSKAGELTAEVTPRSFANFKRRSGKVALLLPLGQDEDTTVGTRRMFKQSPLGFYEAGLLRRRSASVRSSRASALWRSSPCEQTGLRPVWRGGGLQRGHSQERSSAPIRGGPRWRGAKAGL